MSAQDKNGTEAQPLSRATITVVSGLPRSGTSMMMKMLEAGGMPILTDHIRSPDEDNPRGYFEFERVKQIDDDQAWLEDAAGKAVKMISALLKHLPPTFHYRVVFMQREMAEILTSQRQMLIRRGEPTDRIGDEKMAAVFRRHLSLTESWLNEQPNMEVLYVRYDQAVQDPAAQAHRVNLFLGGSLDVQEMMRVVDPNLYRQRH